MEFDIKIDFSDGTPFKIRQVLNNNDIIFREIEPEDQQFFDYMSQTQKYKQIKRIDGQSQLLLNSQIINKTVIIEDIQQLNERSDVFLVILLYDNQYPDYVYYYLSILHQEQQRMKDKYNVFQKFMAIIIINDRHSVQLKIEEQQPYFDDSSAKLIVNYQIKEIQTHLFILDLKFDNNQLNNLVYQGFAAHFKPKYLLVQELSYKIENLDEYFNNIQNNVAAIMPQKDYDKENYLKNQLLFQQYILQYKSYVNYHSKKNTYYDSFNCFYNYEIAQQFVEANLFESQQDFKNQEFCNLNLQFCSRIHENQYQIIQKNKIYYETQENQNQNQNIQNENFILFENEKKEFKSLNDEPQKMVRSYLKALKLKQQINFIQKQYFEMNKLILIQITDYLQLSQYLFIIIILPYYFIREQTNNQAIQVFISIIPGFIVVILAIIQMLINIIFCIGDPIIIGNRVKTAKLAIYRNKQKLYYYDYFGNNDKVQKLNRSLSIEKGNLMFALKPDLKLQQNEFQVINITPKIITYPILWIQNQILNNIIVTILNIIYYALIIYLLTYSLKNQDQIRFYISLLIAILIFVQIIFALQFKSMCFKYLLHQVIYFIQINIFNNIIEAYNKSNQIEHNYYQLRNFIVKIQFNIIFLFIFIVVDYCNNFNGGVFLGILFFQVLKQVNHHLYIIYYKLFDDCLKSTKLTKLEQINDQTFHENEEKLNKKAQDIVANTYIHASGLLIQPQKNIGQESKLLQDKTVVRKDLQKQQSDEQAIDMEAIEEQKSSQKINSNNDYQMEEGKPLIQQQNKPNYQSQVSGRNNQPIEQQAQQNQKLLF